MIFGIPADYTVHSVGPEGGFSGDGFEDDDVDFLRNDGTTGREQFESTVDLYYETQYEMNVTDKPTTSMTQTEPTYDVYALN